MVIIATSTIMRVYLFRHLSEKNMNVCDVRAGGTLYLAKVLVSQSIVFPLGLELSSFSSEDDTQIQG